MSEVELDNVRDRLKRHVGYDPAKCASLFVEDDRAHDAGDVKLGLVLAIQDELATKRVGARCRDRRSLLANACQREESQTRNGESYE